MESAGVQENEPDRKIYLSRKNATGRRIVNEKELVDFLTSAGFETIFAEDYSVKEQIRLFSQTCTIVAPHGAGLVNMIFSQTPKVFELFPEDRWYWGYCITLTNTLDGKHIPLIGKIENDMDDFSVNIDRLSSLLY